MRTNFSVIIIMIIMLWKPYLAQRRNRQVLQCTTPEYQGGFCTNLSYCPYVVNLIQTVNRYEIQGYINALNRACGGTAINGEITVCCSYQYARPTPQTTAPVRSSRAPQSENPNNSANTQRPPVNNRTPSGSSTTSLNSKQNCRGPDTRLGECIDIKDCPELLNQLYAKQNEEQLIRYLRASNAICGSRGSVVCCPGSNSQETTTNQLNTGNSQEQSSNLPTVQQGCGRTSNSYKKIVGGEVSKKGAWPWIALLGYDDAVSGSAFKCGGTLITARHVITAAHCLRRDLSFVRFGEHDLSTDTETQHVDISISRKVGHPNYNKRNGRGDIAVLYLDKNVKFNELISPICLPITNELRSRSFVGHTPFVAGWGRTMEGGKSANVLQQLQIPIFENDVCIDSYRKQNRLLSDDQFDSAVLCAGVLTGGKDTCQGDSGGPLMIPVTSQQDVRYYLIGIVSYGIGCARPDIPGVYSSVQFYMDWIMEKV